MHMLKGLLCLQKMNSQIQNWGNFPEITLRVLVGICVGILWGWPGE